MIAFNVNNEVEFDAAVAYLKRLGYRWLGGDIVWSDQVKQVGVDEESKTIEWSMTGWWGEAAQPAPVKEYYIKKFKEIYDKH